MEGPEPRAWVLGVFCSLLSCAVVYNNGRQKVLELVPLMCSPQQTCAAGAPSGPFADKDTEAVV